MYTGLVALGHVVGSPTIRSEPSRADSGLATPDTVVAHEALCGYPASYHSPPTMRTEWLGDCEVLIHAWMDGKRKPWLT